MKTIMTTEPRWLRWLYRLVWVHPRWLQEEPHALVLRKVLVWEKASESSATKSTDMGGDVCAKGATRCTIKFYDNHKTAPYCRVSGNRSASHNCESASDESY